MEQVVLFGAEHAVADHVDDAVQLLVRVIVIPGIVVALDLVHLAGGEAEDKDVVVADLSSAITRSELVTGHRRIMPESSQAGIRDGDRPESKSTERGSLS